MARRRESVADILLIVPCWISGILAAVAYLGLTYLAPALLTGHPVTQGMGQGLAKLAPLFTGFFLLLGLASFIRSFFVARKFDKQKGIEDIRSLSWRQFESIVGEAFRRRGYIVMENATDGADDGVDLVLRKDAQKFFVQCKQWKQAKVGVKPVRELFGVISARGVAGGFFVVSGTYTEEARKFAETSGIELIDGSALALMVAEAQSAEPFLDPTISNARSTTTWSSGSETPLCPVCGRAMVGRTAKRGANSGSQFWGCSQYPRCKGTRVIA
jgi:restriction system protein